MIKCKCNKKAKWKFNNESYCDDCARNLLEEKNLDTNEINKYYIEDIFSPLQNDEIIIGNPY